MFTGLLTRANIPGMRDLLELTLPVPQREWIAMGAVAGVAAAFNAPIGGILYSFEEVCSHWSHKVRFLEHPPLPRRLSCCNDLSPARFDAHCGS